MAFVRHQRPVREDARDNTPGSLRPASLKQGCKLTKVLPVEAHHPLSTRVRGPNIIFPNLRIDRHMDQMSTGVAVFLFETGEEFSTPVGGGWGWVRYTIAG